MTDQELSPGQMELPLVFEAEWSRATMLGEAVWARACIDDRTDPKDPAQRAAHDRVVDAVRSAAFILEREGFDGLAQWLDDEEQLSAP